MAEWSKAAVLKTVVPQGPGVRIPLSPPKNPVVSTATGFFLFVKYPLKYPLLSFRWQVFVKISVNISCGPFFIALFFVRDIGTLLKDGPPQANQLINLLI